MNRLREGFVYVKNPFNANQISKVAITKDVVDCIVFWTKDPQPILKYLPDIDEMGYNYYFQVTITPYDTRYEKNVREKKEIADTFIELSDILGKERVILRYDPIFLAGKYTLKYHIRAFQSICDKLNPYTNKVIFSFVDGYKKTVHNTKDAPIQELTNSDMLKIAEAFSEITKPYGLLLETCAEKIQLTNYGISPARCIDGDLIQSIIGYEISNKSVRDDNREACGCMKCIDIGQYDTCTHGCTYCYANINKDKAQENYNNHNPLSPMLVGSYEHAIVKERKDVKSFRIEQLSLDI
jgi:hypothetical protein